MATPERETGEEEEKVPPGALPLMGFILAVMALVAVFANIQKARRPQTETVTIAPAAPTLSPTPSATP